MTSRTRLKRKEVDDVLGGDDMWKHADSTAGEYYCEASRFVRLTISHSFMSQVRPWTSVLLHAANPFGG